jgi:hypothetical protein
MSAFTSEIGTKLPISNVRGSVAIGGKADVARTASLGRD